jgi:hypothetical protein
LLPDNCHPIIVADAGFQVPWHELVLSLGWNYVGRVRKLNDCKLNDDDGDTPWLHPDEVFKKSTSTAKCYKGLLTVSNEFETTLILYQGPAKGRHKETTEGKRCLLLTSFRRQCQIFMLGYLVSIQLVDNDR